MIKLKLYTKDEQTALFWFVSGFRAGIKSTGNHYFDILLTSLIDELENKLDSIRKSSALECTLSLKNYQAVALYCIWMDSKTPRPEFQSQFYAIVAQKMNYLQQKLMSLNVSNSLQM